MSAIRLELPADPAPQYSYARASSRNLGLVDREEQSGLRRATVAIAGMGGVGGVHALTLARLGIGGFRLGDFDTFEQENFNRQVGATLSTVGRTKVEVMTEMVRDINPTAEVTGFGDGVTAENVEDFLRGADVAIDGLDFFAPDARQIFYRTAARLEIPVVTAGPIGASTAWLVFRPGGMSFDDYFALDRAKRQVDRHLLFALGLAPRATHRGYIDLQHVDLERKRGPSLASAVTLCAGVVGAEVLKLLLGRGRIYAAPYYHQFDPYTSRYVRGRLSWGNRGPLQRLKYWWLGRTLTRISRLPTPELEA